jgi:mannose-1-phosphate guanylyltransferase
MRSAHIVKRLPQMPIASEHLYAVIMAGGIGSRFWPKSRELKPKQYLAMIDDETLIQNTVARLQGLVDSRKLFIITTRAQQPHLREQLPNLPLSQLIFEPVGRNTAPAIGLAAVHLCRLDPDAVMIAAPADHHISRTDLFYEALYKAVDVVEKNHEALITLGIQPSYPSTGYGYIETGEQQSAASVYRVNRFTEKPDKATAERFLHSGNFFWNSGIFVWKAATLLDNIRRFMPELYENLSEIKESLDSGRYDSICDEVYQRINGQSIDYGIMEKADTVYMIKAEFGWSDVGSWQEAYNLSPKDEDQNVIIGKPLLKNVKNSYIDVGSRTVSIIGADSLIVIEQPDALLICGMDQSQDVRWVTNELVQKNRRS